MLCFLQFSHRKEIGMPQIAEQEAPPSVTFDEVLRQPLPRVETRGEESTLYAMDGTHILVDLHRKRAVRGNTLSARGLLELDLALVKRQAYEAIRADCDPTPFQRTALVQYRSVLDDNHLPSSPLLSR